MKILGTGLSGLVGSRIVELLNTSYQFKELSSQGGIDITNRSKVQSIIASSKASYVLHFAAKTNVDECEKEKDLANQSESWKVNVEGTRNIVDACKKSGKRLLYISTDFVFGGEKPEGEYYIESDEPSPVNWYARTKYEGEKIVQELPVNNWVIIRLSYPYRAHFIRPDFVRTILKKLQQKEQISMIYDHYINPTFIDDIAYAIERVIQKEENGIFHVVGSDCITPFDAAIAIAKEFKKDTSLITKISRKEFFNNRAQRPFNLCLRNDKIEKLGVKMKGMKEGLKEMKKQLSQNLNS